MPHTIPADAERTAFEAAACRCMVYGVLSLGLRTPTTAVIERLGADDTRQALLDAVRHLEIVPEGAAVRSRPENGGPHTTEVALVARAEALESRLAGLDPEGLRALHAGLFGHTLRGRVCPYESEYGQDALFQQSQQLADVAGFYDAFGLTVTDTERERPDHLSCELEFMEFLARKEAFALDAGDTPMLDGTRQAARLFLAGHLSDFARAFALSLVEQAPGSFYEDIGRLLYDFVTLECARQRLEPGPALMRLRPTEEPDVPMQCGSACDVASCAPENFALPGGMGWVSAPHGEAQAHEPSDAVSPGGR